MLCPPRSPHGSWVPRGSPRERRCGCCGHAAHMAPCSLQGKMLMEYLIPQDPAVGKSSVSDASSNKHCHSRKPPQLLTQRLECVRWLHRVLSWGLQDLTVAPTLDTPHCSPLCPGYWADKALPVKQQQQNTPEVVAGWQSILNVFV